MNIKKIVKLFEKGSVMICGVRGRGKDMLTANVCVRRKKPYVSNIDYGGEYIPFNYKDFDINNTYRNLISGNINKYVFPYPDGTDIYLSDCGVYFPSQYCNELNKEYKSLPLFLALSRQVGLSNFFLSSQYLRKSLG